MEGRIPQKENIFVIFFLFPNSFLLRSDNPSNGELEIISSSASTSRNSRPEKRESRLAQVFEVNPIQMFVLN